MPIIDAADAAATQWDVVVVGTGIGGATLGHALVCKGWRVLFCEKGVIGAAERLVGQYAETFFDPPGYPDSRYAPLLRLAGRYAHAVEDRSSGEPHAFVPFLGAGGGGSSALYGMAMERFFPCDFVPAAHHRADSGANLPATWPVGYDEFAPYYAAAERLYGVRGTPDPLRFDQPALGSTPEWSAASKALIGHLQARGLHPYRLPSACEYVEGCVSCQGYLCPKNCKNDGGRVALRPALEEHGAAAVEDCEAMRLVTSGQRIVAVECDFRGRRIELRGRLVVLACGALATPVLLMRSACAEWPTGIANETGLVGRNLMRHLLDLYAIRPTVDAGQDNRVKDIALNDFYLYQGEKLGSVQSFGRLPPVDVVSEALVHDVRSGRYSGLAPLVRAAMPLIRSQLGRMIDKSLTLATTLEDLPYADNRVMPGGNAKILLQYRIHPDDRRRLAIFRKLVKEVLSPLPYRVLPQADRNERLAHVCGTCRFGDDHRTSVLDRNCRAHGLENLYVVDSSFFPTSGGTNPGLTIAANALRVAEHLAGSATGPYADNSAAADRATGPAHDDT